jgi:transposase-like protein
MLAHCRRDQRGLVSAALREVFNADDQAQGRGRVGHALERLAAVAPKVCQLLEDAEEDLIAVYLLPAEHWTKLRSTNPLERVNKEIGRRSDLLQWVTVDWSGRAYVMLGVTLVGAVGGRFGGGGGAFWPLRGVGLRRWGAWPGLFWGR